MHKFAKLSIALLGLSLIMPNVSSLINHPTYASAKIRHHYRHKIHYHKMNRHYRRRQRHTRKRHHQRTRIHMLKGLSTQMKIQTLNDINNDRKSHGVTPIKENRQLDQLAQYRAKQLTHDFSHYDQHGRTLYQEDAKKMGISLTQHYRHGNTFGYQTASGENIANASLNHRLNYTTMPTDPKIYHNHNGYDMANMDNDAMFNYDSRSNWGHRKNILNRQFKKVGIGVTHRNGTYFLAEDFDS